MVETWSYILSRTLSNELFHWIEYKGKSRQELEKVCTKCVTIIRLEEPPLKCITYDLGKTISQPPKFQEHPRPSKISRGKGKAAKWGIIPPLNLSQNVPNNDIGIKLTSPPASRGIFT